VDAEDMNDEWDIEEEADNPDVTAEDEWDV
jgi:hypothetical protein